MAVSASLLKTDGELVFITPRSYTAGPYFRLFREKFFSTVKPEAFHLFGSRTEAFGRDEILQEHLILKAGRLPVDGGERASPSFVVITSSGGASDLASANKRVVPLTHVITPGCKTASSASLFRMKTKRSRNWSIPGKGACTNTGWRYQPVRSCRSALFGSLPRRAERRKPMRLCSGCRT